jgi:pimeloyl-ACP methyl ester carboxylesterase
VPDHPATFVLVPCAWAGAWIWREIAAGLRAAGHTVFTPALSGMGELVSQATPAITLATHVDNVVTLLNREDLHQVHLVGWSYGGLVISGVAERVPDRLAQLIYLDATVAANGQSGNEAEGASPEEIEEMAASGVAVGLPGFFTHAPAAAWLAESMPDPEVRAWVLANFTPQPMATYTQPLALANPAAARVPRTFIFCTEGKGNASDDHSVLTLERVCRDPAWRVVRVHDTHMAPVNHPAAMAATLAALVR